MTKFGKELTVIIASKLLALILLRYYFFSKAEPLSTFEFATYLYGN